jgi:hypothetical protein
MRSLLLLLRCHSRNALSVLCCVCLLCRCVRVCIVQLFAFLLFERVALLLLLLSLLWLLVVLSLLRLHGSGPAAMERPLLFLLVTIVGIGSRRDDQRGRRVTVMMRLLRHSSRRSRDFTRRRKMLMRQLCIQIDVLHVQLGALV